MINCKKNIRKKDCSLDPNCQWQSSRGCIRRAGVNAGKRFKFDVYGNIVETVRGDPEQNVTISSPPSFKLSLATPFKNIFEPEPEPLPEPEPIKLSLATPFKNIFELEPEPKPIKLSLATPFKGIFSKKQTPFQLKNEPFELEYNPDFDVQKPQLSQLTVFSGTYGITFIPAFPCVSGQTFSNSLGKVFWREQSADEEWEFSKKLVDIEKGTSQKYFTYPKFQCHINFVCPENGTALADMTQPEKELYEYFKDNSINVPKTLPQHVMDYSGIMLNEYFKTYYKTKKATRAEFIHIIENLFYAVKRLIDNKYVHCDIKELNVIISNKKRLRLIDFGLISSFNDFYDPTKNLLLQVPYVYVSAPELTKYINEIKNNRHFGYFALLDSYDEVAKNGTRIYEKIMNGYNRNHYNEMNIRDKDAYIKFLKDTKSAEKQDLYSIGLIIMRFMDILVPENQDPQSDRFNQLLRGLLDPNPRYRLNITQAINLVKEIKKSPHQDPFKVNKDSFEMTDIFNAFGKSKQNSEIRYLRSFI